MQPNTTATAPLISAVPQSRSARERRSAELAALLVRLPQPVHEVLPIGSLTLGPEYGRPLSQRRLADLRPTFGPSALKSLPVSRRADGTNMVIDGQHIVTLAREKGSPTEAHCLVWDRTLSLADEAALYEALNNELPQSRRDIFTSRLVRGETQACAIRQAADDAHVGLNLGRGSAASHRGAQCFSALDYVYETHGGQTHVFATFKFIRSTWGDDPRALRDFVVRGTAAVLKAYPRRLEISTLRELAASEGLSRTLGEAKNKHADRGQGMPDAFADALVDCWNNGVKTRNRKLEPFRGAIPTMPPPGDAVPLRRKHREAVWNERVQEIEGRPS
jgi:hypothetical protein